MKFLTVAEAARMLRIGKPTLLRMVRQGEIPHIRLGPKTIRFDLAAINAWRKQFFDIKGVRDNGLKKTRQDMALLYDGERETVRSDIRTLGLW